MKNSSIAEEFSCPFSMDVVGDFICTCHRKKEKINNGLRSMYTFALCKTHTEVRHLQLFFLFFSALALFL